MKKTIGTSTEATRGELRNPLTIARFDGIAGSRKSSGVYEELANTGVTYYRFLPTGRL